MTSSTLQGHLRLVPSVLSIAMAVSLPVGLAACGKEPSSPETEETTAVDDAVAIEEADESENLATTEDASEAEEDAGRVIADTDDIPEGMAVGSFTEEEYDAALASYDEKHKDEEGAYVGQWYRCKLPEGYTIPGCDLALEQEQGMETPPATFVEVDAPVRLMKELDDGTNGEYAQIWIDRYYSNMSADDRIAQIPPRYGWTEAGEYEAATGITYRLLSGNPGNDDNGTYMYGEWNGGIVSINSTGVSDDALHEFLDNFIPDDDPSAALAAYMEEHPLTPVG